MELADTTTLKISKDSATPSPKSTKPALRIRWTKAQVELLKEGSGVVDERPPQDNVARRHRRVHLGHLASLLVRNAAEHKHDHLHDPSGAASNHNAFHRRSKHQQTTLEVIDPHDAAMSKGSTGDQGMGGLQPRRSPGSSKSPPLEGSEDMPTPLPSATLTSCGLPPGVPTDG